MSEPESTAAKLGAWLSVAGGVIAVLAFFGIARFDDLSRRSSPSPSTLSSPTLSACAIARATSKAYTDAAMAGGDPMATGLIYEAGLKKAAAATNDEVLRAYLMTAVTAMAEYSQLASRQGALWGDSWIRADNARTQWLRYCVTYG